MTEILIIRNERTHRALRTYREAIIAKAEIGDGPARRLAKIIVRRARSEYMEAAADESREEVDREMQHGIRNKQRSNAWRLAAVHLAYVMEE